MGEAKPGVKEDEIGEQSNGCHGYGYPRDLLQRLNDKQERRVVETTSHESEEIELNLGLSLGGRFGVDPKESSKLGRSTSIAGLSTFLPEDDAAAAPAAAFPIVRTSSLPMELPQETEEEWRKRKETQFLRRLEAKRKRTVKKNNRLGKEKASQETTNVGRDKRVAENGLIPNKAKVECRSTSPPSTVCGAVALFQGQKNNGVSPQAMVAPPFGTPNWPRSSVQVLPPKAKANVVVGQGFPLRSAQGSVASHGNSSSGDSKSENPSAQGPRNSVEARSSTSIPSAAELNERKRTPEPAEPKTSASVKIEVESPPKRPRVTDNVTRETENNVASETGKASMPDMPFVSTTGDGPNGRRVQGFLYNYKKGEDVRIVCVCHGKFLTPAEFVRHAGGGDVLNPLKHIVVAQSSPL